MKTYLKINDKPDVIQAQQGDDLAFACLVERYQTPVYNLCYRMLGNPDCAEDAAQESFLRAYRNIDRFDPQHSFISWLLSIAAHYCIDQLRRRRASFISIDQCEKEDDRPLQLADARAVHPETVLEKDEENSALHRVLGNLKTIDRAAIVLHYWYELSYPEVAETLGISVPAVKSRLFRARREISIRLNENAKQRIPAASFSLTQTCGI
jgi:RNA polymerase sigma-70 factor (ECF subfamily)